MLTRLRRAARGGPRPRARASPGAPESRSTALDESEGIHPISGTCTPQACDSAAFGWMTGTAGRSREPSHQVDRGRRPLRVDRRAAAPPREPRAASSTFVDRTPPRSVGYHRAHRAGARAQPRCMNSRGEELPPRYRLEQLERPAAPGCRGARMSAPSDGVPRAASHCECSAQGRTDGDVMSLEGYSTAIGERVEILSYGEGNCLQTASRR